MGALTENHRCPRGPLSRVTEAFTTVAVGGGLGAVLVMMFTDNPASGVVLAAAALGAVLARAVRDALGPRF
jgi:hypothetical protein